MILIEKSLKFNTFIFYVSHLVPSVAAQRWGVESPYVRREVGEDEDVDSRPDLLSGNWLGFFTCVLSQFVKLEGLDWQLSRSFPELRFNENVC